ncbi:MAG: AMP-binding protein [Deltaproteobacteria bacterium]|jgi:phenylacetate-coenzyme A ligase PaaK-like adenylate-forming protein|nr:AMP-binding protein [Deltaproteobacteria bacterium]
MLPWLDQEFKTRLQTRQLWPLETVPTNNGNSERARLAHSLAQWRVQGLAWTLKRAENSAFYGSKSSVNTPAKRNYLADLTNLAQTLEGIPLDQPAQALEERLYEILSQPPLTDPAEVAQNPDLFLAVSQSDVAGVVTVPTSGSTGQAKRIYSTEADLRNTEAFYHYGVRNLVSPDRPDRVALLMSGTRPGGVGDLLGRALKSWPMEFSVPGFPPLGKPEFIDWFRELNDWRPTCLVGVPAQVLALARHDQNYGQNQGLAQTVRAILLSGDVAPKGLIRALENSFPLAKAFLHYGQTEFGLAGAVECRFHLGPHFREADIILEILAPNGQRQPAGKIGEMVLTSLSREAMPLIRYRTGDLGAIAVGDCPCGSIFRRIKTFGRLADQVVWRDGQSLRFWEISQILYNLPGLVGFKALAPQEPDDRLTLLVNAQGGANGDDGSTERALGKLLAGRNWEIIYEDERSVQGQATGKQILYKT